ncbi:protein HESO1 [Ziziphus jujuba]|uniref:Protein HESO1 n=1 Tax=Ziziphus jujuba TaxID=326968 RepID=A0ABM3ID80_ZIZJJ|nr:protein HESO1 [Ziziphus jujuba]XP_048326002.1 protein HESO1 [Ziziphus jujuba]XP_048326003.1 protein HESO1 [Ziziphus jujuba]XP_048326004.1 protein HESO1 [Ziziphus jujuba]
MSAYSTLEHTLREILVTVNPLHDDWATRFRIINELRGVVGSLEVLRGATVEPFGSFVSNLYSRWGDLDISIDLSNGSFISSSGKKHKQNLLRQLLKAMRQKGGWHSLQFIPSARVPILKVESNLQNISCDISIDNLQGQMKSKFLFWINELDGRFRDMVLLVKEWAKAHNINNPKAGTFNSYSLSLLVVFHFQTCVPAIFPPLQDIYPGNIADDLTGLRADAEKYIAETCAANITRFRLDKMRAVNRSSLSELFISFLGKFSDISLKASNLGICTYRGQWEYIESNTRWLPKTYAIFVEDPFEQPQNTARAVNSKQLSRISEAFESTYRRLISVHPSRNSLLDTLVQPKTLRFISRAPVRNHSHNAGYDESTNPQWQRSEHLQLQNRSSNGVRYQTTRPQLPRTGYFHPQNSSDGGRHQPSPQTHTVMNSSSQVHPQFQNVRHEGHYNNASTRKPPLQTHYNQGQQRRWRPRFDK